MELFIFSSNRDFCRLWKIGMEILKMKWKNLMGHLHKFWSNITWLFSNELEGRLWFRKNNVTKVKDYIKSELGSDLLGSSKREIDSKITEVKEEQKKIAGELEGINDKIKVSNAAIEEIKCIATDYAAADKEEKAKKYEAFNKSSEENRNFFVIYLTLTITILIYVIATTDKMILKESPIKLPLIEAEFSIIYFFILAPILVLAFHFNILFNLHHHKAKFDSIKDNIQKDKDTSLIFPFLLNFLISKNNTRDSFIVNTLGFIILFFLPIFTLTCIQIKFSGYQSWQFTSIHFIILLIDIIVGSLYYLSIFERKDNKIWNVGKVFVVIGLYLFHLIPASYNFFLLYRFLNVEDSKEAIANFQCKFWKNDKCPSEKSNGSSNLPTLFDNCNYYSENWILPRLVVRYDDELYQKPIDPVILAAIMKSETDEDKLLIEKAKHVEGLKLVDRNLRFADFSSSNMIGVQFSSSRLHGARFEETVLYNAVFKGIKSGQFSKFTGVFFNQVKFKPDNEKCEISRDGFLCICNQIKFAQNPINDWSIEKDCIMENKK